MRWRILLRTSCSVRGLIHVTTSRLSVLITIFVKVRGRKCLYSFLKDGSRAASCSIFGRQLEISSVCTCIMLHLLMRWSWVRRSDSTNWETTGIEHMLLLGSSMRWSPVVTASIITISICSISLLILSSWVYLVLIMRLVWDSSLSYSRRIRVFWSTFHG